MAQSKRLHSKEAHRISTQGGAEDCACAADVDVKWWRCRLGLDAITRSCSASRFSCGYVLVTVSRSGATVVRLP